MDKNIKVVEWLSGAALRKYKEIIKKLPPKELKKMDWEMLAVYCDSYTNYIELQKRVKSLTKTEYKELQTWSRLVIKFADFLGFSPLVQERLKAEASKKKYNFTKI